VSADSLPLVSVVVLAYNRREQLLESLERMLTHSGYPPDRLEVIVVDNASSDGTSEAVASRYPKARLIRNEHNVGASGWNGGFAVAAGDYVLILDDDAYLRPGDLERGVLAASDEAADLVSFAVVSSFDESTPINDDWRTGLFSYWGCAALLSRRAVRALGGYDPNMFMWTNEVELTMRLLDEGLRHLYMSDIRAVHMKERVTRFDTQRYLVNARHFGYIAAKLMRPVDALATLGNILQRALNDCLVQDRSAIGGVKEVLAGFAGGLPHRRPVRPLVSSAYRRIFCHFAAPWQFMRSPLERIRSRRDSSAAESQRVARRERYFVDRARFYPSDRGSLRL
jgi:GT2 family glycosyltransferase